MGEKENNTLLYSFFVEFFLLGNLHLHSLPRKLLAHSYCTFQVDLDLSSGHISGTSQSKGLCRPEQFGPAQYLAHSFISPGLSDSYRTHGWPAVYAILLSNQSKRKHNCPICMVQKITTDRNGRCFKNQTGESLKEPATQDSPSGLQDRDKCHSTSPPSSSLLGLVFLFIFPLCLLSYKSAPGRNYTNIQTK